MRIIYLHQYFNTPDMSGSTRSYELAHRLVSSGHEVHMITSSRTPQKKNQRMVQEIIEGIHVHWISVPYSQEMKFRERIFSFLRFSWYAVKKSIRIKGDIVFASSTPLTIAIPGIIAKIRHRIPMIFEVRDLWPELPIAVGALRNPVAKKLAGMLEGAAYRASAHIAALSPGMAQGIQKKGIPASKVTVIPNSCDLKRFNVPGERGSWVRRELGLKPNQPLVVYAGAFGMINGTGYLVDIAAWMRKIAPEVRFLMVGKGAEFNKIKNKAAQSNILGENLWIRHSVPKNQMPDILSAASLAVSLFIPIKAMEHNSANKFFDALAAGKPVAINYGGWQAELLNNTGAGIVIPSKDPKTGAQKTAEFLQNKKGLEEAGRAAARLVNEKFSLERIYIRLLNVLEKALN